MAAASETPRPGGAIQEPAGLVPGLRWRRVFGGEERQLGVLRRWLASLLPPCPARDDITAVAHELSSNAVRHTASGQGGWFAVEVTWYGPAVRVAVADSGAPDGPRLVDDPTAEHGRGLVLVRGLSQHTGVIGDRRGRLVWADIGWDDASTPVTAQPPDGYEGAIRDGEAALARRFTGVPAWFGRATLAWWAVAGPEQLVSAPSARELAGVLYRLLEASAPLRLTVTGPAHGAAGEQPVPRQHRGPGAGHPNADSHRRPGTASAGMGRATYHQPCLGRRLVFAGD